MENRDLFLEARIKQMVNSGKIEEAITLNEEIIPFALKVLELSRKLENLGYTLTDNMDLLRASVNGYDEAEVNNLIKTTRAQIKVLEERKIMKAFNSLFSIYGINKEDEGLSEEEILKTLDLK